MSCYRFLGQTLLDLRMPEETMFAANISKASNSKSHQSLSLTEAQKHHLLSSVDTRHILFTCILASQAFIRVVCQCDLVCTHRAYMN